MKYKRVQRMENYRTVKDQIVKLWLECSTYEEFKAKVSLDVPEAKWTDLLACKLHWIRKSHPIAYYFSWIVAIPYLIWFFSFAFFYLIKGMSEDSFAYSIAVTGLVNIVILFLHLGFVGDFMRELKWNEDGRPLEY